MEPEKAQEVAERDQLWASLRALHPEIARLAAGAFDGSPRQQNVVALIARIVVAELEYRDRENAPE